MAAAAPITSSTRETTNYARLCRLLVDVGTHAFRDTFDAIHAPATLHTVLAGSKTTTLQSLRTRRIINATQWGKLFPAIPTAVSSRDFDITLLMVLLRNVCGLHSPATGWDKLPAVTDVSHEADIARVKYFRNTVYAHAEHASVDDTTFNTYWQDIRDTLVRLGGVQYRAAIDNLETECMDPEIEDHYKELLSQWKKDEDNVKDKLDEIGSGIGKVMQKLDDLEAANITLKKEITVEGKVSMLKETTNGPVMCKEKYHENEAVEYYCQECEVCICHKCSVVNHNRHTMADIQQAAEERKLQMTRDFDRVKKTATIVETMMKEQIELMKKSEDEISAAETKATETVEEIIRAAREHEAAIKTELAEIKEAQQRDHERKLEDFRLFATELRSFAESGEGIVQRNIGPEILVAGHAAMLGRCEERLTRKIKIYKPRHVTYVTHVNKEPINAARHLVLGQVVASHTDPSQSLAEGKGLKEAELGAETNFTITTRDSEGNRFYNEEDQVTVKICSSTGENEEKDIEDRKDGSYIVRYKPKSVGLHDVAVQMNDQPLTGSPWSVQVTPHQYKALHSFGSRGKGRGKFDWPVGIAVSKRTENIAIADRCNKRVQLFDSEWNYLRSIGDKGTGAKRINKPRSVAFTASGDVIVTHGELSQSRKLSIFTEDGQFIKHVTEHLVNPTEVFVSTDGHMIVCDVGDKSIKVLSPDGTELLQSFSVSHSDKLPWFAVFHQDMFFVSFYLVHCIKVLDKKGVFLYDVGREGSGDGQMLDPDELAIDKFNNLIVCDRRNNRLQVFTLDGTFVNSVNQKGMGDPLSVAVTKDGHVLVCDDNEHCIRVFQ